MGVSKKKMGGFLVTTLIIGSIIVSCLLVLYKVNSNKNKYDSKVRLISYTEFTIDFEFKIQKFYGMLVYLKENGKIESFFNEQMKEKMREEGFLNYQVNNVSKEIILIFEKDKYFNYQVNLRYNNENELKFMIKNIYETRKNEN